MKSLLLLLFFLYKQIHKRFLFILNLDNHRLFSEVSHCAVRSCWNLKLYHIGGLTSCFGLPMDTWTIGARDRELKQSTTNYYLIFTHQIMRGFTSSCYHSAKQIWWIFFLYFPFTNRYLSNWTKTINRGLKCGPKPSTW